MRALLMTLDQPKKVTESQHFTAGLEACGFKVHRQSFEPTRDDMLVIWNRQGVHHTMAKRFEQAKAKVVVAENGYLGASWRGDRWYAMALNHHNGAGRWPEGGPERWDGWNVEIEPMREISNGETVLLAQRGIGEPALRCPDRWVADAARLFRARIRRHPGTSTAGPTLRDDIKNASAVVTWSSGAGLKAMLMGHQCFYGMPNWIGAPAALPISFTGLAPDRRLATFRRLAWAMWSGAETSSGEPFRRLLSC